MNYTMKPFITILLSFFLVAACNSQVSNSEEKPSDDCQNLTRLRLERLRWCLITPGETQEFLYYGESRQSVTISASARSNDLDLRLVIQKYGTQAHDEGSQGKVLKSDDNSGLALDPLIENLKLPETTVYKVLVIAWGEPGGRGPELYAISVRSESSLFSSWIAALLIGIFSSIGLMSLIIFIFRASNKKGKSAPTEELTLSDQERAGRQDGEDAYERSATGPILTKLHYLEQLLEDAKLSDEALSIVRKQRDSMEALMNEYKTGYNFRVLQNALMGIIEAYEYAKETQTNVLSSEDLNKEAMKAYLSSIEINLEQALGDAGVESFTPNIGDSYQEAYGVESVRTIPTDDPALIGTVAEVISVGYTSILPENQLDKEIVRKARVAIFVDKDL